MYEIKYIYTVNYRYTLTEKERERESLHPSLQPTHVQIKH